MRVPERVATAILTAFSVGLLVGGFLAPPMGVIDGSVLMAAGILFAFSALWVFAYAINVKGAKADTDIKIGNTQVHLGVDGDDEE